MLASALDQANSTFLSHNKSPSRKVGELDVRGSHFYLALYWARALAEQDQDSALQAQFSVITQQLTENEDNIISELNAVQGKATDIGGYYYPNQTMAAEVMRPSERFNAILSDI